MSILCLRSINRVNCNDYSRKLLHVFDGHSTGSSILALNLKTMKLHWFPDFPFLSSSLLIKSLNSTHKYLKNDKNLFYLNFSRNRPSSCKGSTGSIFYSPVMVTSSKFSVYNSSSYSIMKHFHTDHSTITNLNKQFHSTSKNYSDSETDDEYKLKNDPAIREILSESKADFKDEITENDAESEESLSPVEIVHFNDRHSEKEIDCNWNSRNQVFDFHKLTKENRDTVKGFEEYPVDASIDTEEEPEPKWTSPVDFKRGRHGVFDVDELLTVLQTEHAQDICVIQLPANVQFGDQMLIVSVMSYRHMNALTEKIKWIYKRKKTPKDLPLKIEGKDTKDWFAIDLGNLILHIFLPETRKYYDLESLWTLGPEFDDCSKEEKDPYAFQLSEWPWLQTKHSVTFNKSHSPHHKV